MQRFFVPVALAFATYSNLIVRETASAIPPQRIDQRQTGDYNLHLHLKDFHIIALLDSFAADSSYEYDYEVPEEYLDVTSAVVHNATNTTVAASSTITTKKPATEGTTKLTSSTTAEPTTEKIENASHSHVIKPEDHIKVEHKNETNNFHYPNDAGKIPVVILQESSNVNVEKASGNVAIISVESDEGTFNNSSITPGDIFLHYKKCPYGFSKDKRGRCRKNHRSQLAFNIARLASSWIRRLKYSKEESTLQSKNEDGCNSTTPDVKTK